MKKPSPELDNRPIEERMIESLAKTGFVFENEVADEFRKKKWGVITGRYYVDDVDGRARELDIVAYKLVSKPNIDVVTTVLTSCKKDAENAWAVLTRAREQNDPNTDLASVHYWTNNDILDAYLGSTDWRDSYVKGNGDLYRDIFRVDRQAFAFQLVSKSTSAPKNDRPIFESFAELVKALDHELSVLPECMKKNRVYVFNLLVAIDAPIYEVSYDKAKPNSAEIFQFQHFVQYIVRKRQREARVHLCAKRDLASAIKSYDALVRHDAEHFDKAIDRAYATAPENYRVGAVFSKILLKEVRWILNSELRKSGEDALGLGDELSLGFDNKKGELLVWLPGLDAAAALNDSEKAKRVMASALTRVLRYTGKFRFDSQIPF